MGYCRIGINTFCIKELCMEATYLIILQAVWKTLFVKSSSFVIYCIKLKSRLTIYTFGMLISQPCLTFVASFRTVTATHSSTLTGDLMLVHFFCVYGHSSLHIMLNVSRAFLNSASTNSFQVSQTGHHETSACPLEYTMHSIVFFHS